MKNIKKIHLPEGIFSLYGTFSECINLKEISFPSTIKYIDGFALCTEGTADLEVCFRGDHPDFYVENGCLIQASTKTLVRYIEGSSESVNIPKNVRAIGRGAFTHCNGLKTIEIPHGIESISDEAFSWCKNLNVITIPSTVKSIGIGLFWSTNSRVVISPENRYYRVVDNYIIETPTQTIVDILDRSIQEAIIPEGIREIGKRAFSECYHIKKVNLPDTITAIREQAFFCCDKLEMINLPDSLEIIESYAFCCCPSMDYIVIPANLHTFGEGIFSGSSGRVFCEYSVAEWKNLSLDWKGLFGGMTIYTKGKWYLEDGKPVLKPRKKKEKIVNKSNADMDLDDIELEFDDMEFDDLLLDEDF